MSYQLAYEWFAYHPEDGFEYFALESEARAQSNAWLSEDRLASVTDGWHEDQEAVCYGRLQVVAHAQIVSRKPALPDSLWDELINYELKP